MRLLAAIFTAAAMFSAAVATSDPETGRVVRDRGVLARAFLANVVIVPALAAALVHLFRLESGFAMGALLAAACPGAPFGTYLASRFRHDVPLAMVLTVGLTPVALISTPIASRLMFGAGNTVALPRGYGLLIVTVTMFFPVALGRAIRERWPDAAIRLGRAANHLALIAMLAGSLTVANLRSEGVRLAGWRGAAMILVIVAASIAVGWLWGSSRSTRATLANSTGLRNVGLAYLFAEHTFPGSDVPLGVAAFSLLMLPPNFLFALWTRRRRKGNGG
jgi:BASS family bile acid:Na+ symporter